MKDYTRSFPRLVSVPVLTLTLIGSFAYFAPGNSLRVVAAQSTSSSGSFGFVAGVSQIDSNGGNGGALVGVMNFDGAGNVAGTATVKPRSTGNQQAQAIPSTFTGTYSSNPAGAGSVTLAFDVGFGVTLAVVPTDGGQGFQLLQTNCSPCGADVPLQGQRPSLSGGLPIALFFNGATGNIPLNLQGSATPGGGTTIYTATTPAATGTAQCPDGSSGTWTANVPNITLVVNPDIPSVATNGGSVSGNYLAAIFGTICGHGDFETLSGLVTGAVSPGGATSLVLHGAGSVASGIARAAAPGGSLNGSYGVQLSYSPFPAGAGNNTAASATLTGTYSINPDGSGTINLKTASGQSAGPAFSFVITDGGSQLLLLRTDNNAAFDVAFGTARLQ
jgi:hypothetical protein